MISCIYTITNILSNKTYVGYTKNYADRIVQHKYKLNNNIHPNESLQKDWTILGKDNFRFEILEEYADTFLTSMEHYWANLLNVHNNMYGYNIKPTGEHSGISVETGIKIGNTLRGRKRPQEFKEKMKVSSKKWKRSKEHIKKLHLGRKNRINISGSYHSEEGSNNIRKAMSSRIISEQSRLKMRKAKSKPIIQISLKGEFIKEWGCASDVFKELGISAGNISNACIGRVKTAGKYIWKFKENNNEKTTSITKKSDKMAE